MIADRSASWRHKRGSQIQSRIYFELQLCDVIKFLLTQANERLTLFYHSRQKKSGNLHVERGMASYRGSDSSTQSNKLSQLISAELEIDSTKVEANLRSPRAESPSASCSTPVSTPRSDSSLDATQVWTRLLEDEHRLVLMVGVEADATSLCGG